MSEYTVAAIPTVYDGRRYRSRLEACWAAFFDRLQLDASYEPFDLTGWIPDFSLDFFHILIEVKPFDSFDLAVARKCIEAGERHGLFTRQATYNSVLITRRTLDVDATGFVHIGWLAYRTRDGIGHRDIHVGWCCHPHRPIYLGWLFPAGDPNWADHHKMVPFGRHTVDLWKDCLNTVQYRAGGQP